MGQYFKWVNIDKKQYIDAYYFNQSNKINGYLTNDSISTNAVLTLLDDSWKTDRVIFVGDYDKNENNNPLIDTLVNINGDNLYEISDNYDNATKLFMACDVNKLDEEINYKEDIIKEHNKEIKFFRYVINHTKREYFERSLESWFNPFALLLVSAGDYVGGMFGYWIGDFISVTNNIIDYVDLGYKNMSNFYTIGNFDEYRNKRAITKDRRRYYNNYSPMKHEEKEHDKYQEYRYYDKHLFNLNDNNNYCVAKVVFDDHDRSSLNAATYMINDIDVKMDDRVIVPLGDEYVIGVVVEIRQCKGHSLELPLDRYREIVKIIDKDISDFDLKQELINCYPSREQRFVKKYGISPFTVIKYRTYNRETINKSSNCICYHCKTFFDASEVTEYLKRDADHTAICPYCKEAFVIGGASRLPIHDNTFVDDLHNYWFSNK